MASYLALRLEMETLTPLYLGGADQGPELRAASLKGLLRFWYRAADPGFLRPWNPGGAPRESVLFGAAATGDGQSPFLLHLPADSPPSVNWRDLKVERFNRGSGRDTRNGLVYLGFPFQLRGNEARRAIAPGYGLKVRCLIPRPWRDEGKLQVLRRTLTSAFWLLGHVGGVGSRARRGFGALALTGWHPENGEWPELAELPLLHTLTDPAEWRAGLKRGFATLQNWFGDFNAEKGQVFRHPHLGPKMDWAVLGRAYPKHQWAEALVQLGEEMQAFRAKRPPDYEKLKEQALAQVHRSGSPLRQAPERAAFGLPLSFRFPSVPRARPVNIVPFDPRRKTTFERHGSLLFLRPVLAGDRLYPLVLRLDGDLPGKEPPGAIRSAGRALFPAQGDLLVDFLMHVRRH